MAQGKAWNKEEVIEALKPLFKTGMNVNKACKSAGFPQSTVQTWIDNSEELRLKIGVWQSEPSRLARSSWIAKLAEGDYIASRDWLTKTERDEFSERVENTGKDGGPIQYEDLSQLSDDQLAGLTQESESGTSS